MPIVILFGWVFLVASPLPAAASPGWVASPEEARDLEDAHPLAQADTVSPRAHVIPHFGISVETIGDEPRWGVSSIHWGARLELERGWPIRPALDLGRTELGFSCVAIADLTSVGTCPADTGWSVLPGVTWAVPIQGLVEPYVGAGVGVLLRPGDQDLASSFRVGLALRFETGPGAVVELRRSRYPVVETTWELMGGVRLSFW